MAVEHDEVGGKHDEGNDLQNDDEEDCPAEGDRVKQDSSKGWSCSEVQASTFKRCHQPTKAPKANTEVQRPETRP